ncbi:MAG: hypothetical protein J6A89_04400 [Clostridia bacterium]|nr:hypothetical protein [Clostridia bacterium]
MINKLEYMKLKKVLLKNLKNQRVCIEIKGIISTQFFIEKTKVIINKHKMILADENKEFELEFLKIKKIKFQDMWSFKIIYEDFNVVVEI